MADAYAYAVRWPGGLVEVVGPTPLLTAARMATELAFAHPGDEFEVVRRKLPDGEWEGA